MKRLILITGVSGVGKTTIAKEIRDNIRDSVYICVDTVREGLNDIVGFNNLHEKHNIRSIAFTTALSLLEECMRREDKTIILVYTLDKDWAVNISALMKFYAYKALTLNVYCEDFDIMWDRLVKRRLSKERHSSHRTDSYKPNSTNFVINQGKIYEDLKQDYINGKYTKLGLGEEINFVHKDGVMEYKELLESINAVINKKIE